MVTIRREQMEAMRQALLERYYRDILHRAEQEAPSMLEGRSSGEWLDLLRGALQRGPEFGIFLADDVARYGRLVLRLGFDPATADGAIRQALVDPQTMGSAKMEALEKALEPARPGAASGEPAGR